MDAGNHFLKSAIQKSETCIHLLVTGSIVNFPLWSKNWFTVHTVCYNQPTKKETYTICFRQKCFLGDQFSWKIFGETENNSQRNMFSMVNEKSIDFWWKMYSIFLGGKHFPDHHYHVTTTPLPMKTKIIKIPPHRKLTQISLYRYNDQNTPIS